MCVCLRENLTQAGDIMVLHSLAELNGVRLHPPLPLRTLLIGQLLSVHLLTEELVAGDLRVIGRRLPCDLEGVHFGLDF